MKEELLVNDLLSLCDTLLVHQKQQRHLLAARSIIQETTESAGIPSSPVGDSQKISPSKEAPEETLSQVESGKEAEQQHTDSE